MPFPGKGVSQNLGLSITNPLILYRALVATKKIRSDPAQHRLALQLQKLYFRLKDYAPEIEYRYRLERVARRSGVKPYARGREQDGSEQREVSSPPQSRHEKPQGKGFRLSTLMQAYPTDALALTRTAPLHDSAVAIDSPQGMLLYGEVGRGKSMLLDLLYSSLPSRQKRRWHFNTFMLDIYRRIETTRLERLEDKNNAGIEGRSWLFSSGISEHEHVVLSLAKDTISESPILFLDEFQMPDRTTSKLINSFFTTFFHLGGVLVASSNRMPEELSKAAGIEFGGKGAQGRVQSGGLWGLGWGLRRESPGELQAKSDFGLFLDVLRARCEVWEMEGERDWRRECEDEELMDSDMDADGDGISNLKHELHDTSDSVGVGITPAAPGRGASAISKDTQLSSDSPPYYHIAIPQPTASSTSFQHDILSLNPSDTWTPSTLTIYARQLHLPHTHSGILKASFSSLCASYLGPADYVSLCSTFHTLILTQVPVLTLLQKNEARRFITLLDALYEAQCRLLVEAEAPPDKLFFPESRRKLRPVDGGASGESLLPEDESDSITSEAFSEMYQDSTAPFRPNITSYSNADSSASISSVPSFTRSLQSPTLRSVLADEDADFGPTYGNGRSQGASSGRINLDIGPSGMAEHELRQGPDFTQTSALTGEDERFAYKRARSRLWEMCGRRWWDYRSPEKNVEDWWRPVGKEGRVWERFGSLEQAVSEDVLRAARMEVEANTDNVLFKHNASPFRTSADPPPKFGWEHAWGMMKWGKKAGEWGKGVDGDRKKDQSRKNHPIVHDGKDRQ